MKKSEGTSLTDWLIQLKRVAELDYGFDFSGPDFDEEAWEIFYRDDLTPEAAIVEDLSNA